eukprot:GDKH01012277.1.p2 GENE.GDKH01012277.1~~GDKH01012277.1.p2  ORF type:complete len:71 (+),score=8.29 GDKH01012277.1:94-306(+)
MIGVAGVAGRAPSRLVGWLWRATGALLDRDQGGAACGEGAEACRVCWVSATQAPPIFFGLRMRKGVFTWP